MTVDTVKTKLSPLVTATQNNHFRTADIWAETGSLRPKITFFARRTFGLEPEVYVPNTFSTHLLPPSSSHFSGNLPIIEWGPERAGCSETLSLMLPHKIK